VERGAVDKKRRRVSKDQYIGGGEGLLREVPVKMS